MSIYIQAHPKKSTAINFKCILESLVLEKRSLAATCREKQAEGFLPSGSKLTGKYLEGSEACGAAQACRSGHNNPRARLQRSGERANLHLSLQA